MSFAQDELAAWKSYHADAKTTDRMGSVVQRFYVEWYWPNMRAFPQTAPFAPDPSPA